MPKQIHAWTGSVIRNDISGIDSTFKIRKKTSNATCKSLLWFIDHGKEHRDWCSYLILMLDGWGSGEHEEQGITKLWLLRVRGLSTPTACFRSASLIWSIWRSNLRKLAKVLKFFVSDDTNDLSWAIFMPRPSFRPTTAIVAIVLCRWWAL